MAWFRRSSNQDAERVAREAAEMADPYNERAMVVEGDRAIVAPVQILENIHDRMELFDLDPDTGWAIDQIMPLDEADVMFNQLGMGERIVIETAWYARQILSRWPADLVEHQLSPEARIEMFLQGPNVEPDDDSIGRQVINRALASPDRVEEYPELEDISAEKLLPVWLAVMFWFCIKSMMLNRREQGDLPE